MSCGCIYVDVEDTSDWKDSRMVRSPVYVRCTECRRYINPLARHEKVVGRWDEHVSTFRTCKDCLSIRRTFFCDGYYYTMVWDRLDEHVQDLSGEISSECLEDLTPSAKVSVLNIIDRVFEETDELWCT